jgi:predicted RecB family nuclease
MNINKNNSEFLLQTINKLSQEYSKRFDLKLVNYDIFDKFINNGKCYICQKTNQIYFIKINNSFSINRITQILRELDKNNYKILEFEITNSSNDNYIINNQFYELISVSDITINNPKRKRDEYEETTELTNPEHKKRRISDNIWSEMVSGSSIRNYMLNDPLIDFLKEYNINSLDDKPLKKSFSSSNTNNQQYDLFTKSIMDAGIEFEEELYKILQQKHNIVQVADFTQAKSKDKVKETIELMKQGIPIIYQGVLHNYENKTFGVPDLLVRSDYINKLMGYQVISKEESKISSKLGTPFHYKVIDIKHSTIPLRADATHILNCDSIPAYKGQLYIYTMALNKIQEININKAYIWGKKYNWEKKGVKYEETNFLNKLGIIDYDNIDSDYITSTNNAIQWIQTLRKEGHNWTLLPIPCRKELFPNMKNEKDGYWNKIKKELNDKIYEITSIWNCGVKRREMAYNNNVYGWNNPMCTSELMGFKKGKIANTIDSILDINRQNVDLIRPNKINFEREKWYKINKDVMEFYLDFETLNSNFGSIIKEGVISYNSNQYIFMIGVGYFDKKWIYKSFIMKNKDSNSENQMMDEFHTYINNILLKYNKTQSKFYHWSHAEVSAYNNFKSRNSEFNLDDSHFSFYDLNKVFISEPVVIKGALDYSLKTIAKSLYENKLINSYWNVKSPISSGLNAMIMANQIYEKQDDVNFHSTQEQLMSEIIKYNEIDCKVLMEIHHMMINKL